MSNEINEAIDEAVNNITVSGRCIWCEGADGELRDDITLASSGYAYYPDSGKPVPDTADDYIAAALMKDGRICLVNGGCDWELEEHTDVGAQGLAALLNLFNSLERSGYDHDDYSYDYLDSYIESARGLWLVHVIDVAEEMDNAKLSEAAEKARDDDEESIFFLLDNIEDIAEKETL